MREILGLVDYKRGGYIPSTVLGWTNTVDNIPSLTASEKLYIDKVRNNSCSLLHQPEHKSPAVLKTILRKYSQPVDLVFDLFSSSLSTERACLLMWQHGRRLISDFSTECFRHGVLQLVELFPRNTGIPGSEITGSPDLENAAALFVQTLESVRSQRFNKTWNVPSDFLPLHLFPPEIRQLICASPNEFSFYRHCQNILYNSCSPTWRTHFDEMDQEIILEHDLQKKLGDASVIYAWPWNGCVYY